jgi:hypothetical protein
MQKLRSILRLLFPLVLISATILICWGQLQTGLTGEVSDSSHAVIAGARVTVRNANTGVELATETNAAGIYNFPVLAAGEYDLGCEATGFKRYFQRGVTLDTGFFRRLDIELQVGEVTESVEVTSSAPLLETETASVGQLVERQTVSNMPLESRRSRVWFA